MRKNKRNNKAGLVLISLILVGYIFINLGQKITFGNESVQAPKEESLPEPQQECTNCAGGVEEEIIPEEPQIAIAMLDEEYTVDITGEVKNLSDVWEFVKNFPTCDAYDPAQTLDSVNRLCGEGGTTVNMDQRSIGEKLWDYVRGNTEVNANAITDVELTTVTYPLAFFLGQFVIENSNREASLESPNYPSNGQIIDKNYTLKTHSPADAEEYSERLDETVREDYEVSASIDAKGTDGATLKTDDLGEGKYGVMNINDAECACEEPEVSNSDYNPGSPNRQGSEAGGWSRQQAPDGDNYEIPPLDQCLARGEDYEVILFGNVLACYDPLGTAVGKVSGVFSRIFSRGEWENCNEQEEVCVINDQGEEVCSMVDPTEHCTGSMEIGVRMTPIFGDPYTCEDELCANAYLTNSYKAGLGPSEAKSKVIEGGSSEDSLMFFIGTPCRANVTVGGSRDDEGKVDGGSTRNVVVTCLWDVSPYLLDYKLQKTFEAPNDDEFPSSFEIYWDLVQQAMELSADYYGLE
jgi:hypothetical protein